MNLGRITVISRPAASGGSSPPVIALSAGPTTYNQSESQKVIDGALTVTDADSSSLASATIQITSGIQTGDVIVFAGHGGIPAGTWDNVDKLTITGTASKATWEAALRLVKFQNTLLTAATTGTRTLTWVVSDGVNESDPETIDIDVSNVATPADPEIADFFVVYKMTYDGTGGQYYRKNTYTGNVTCTDPVGRFQFQGKRFQMDGTDDVAAWDNPIENGGADGAFSFDAKTSINGSANQEVASPGAPVLMRVRADAWGQTSNWVESSLEHVFCTAPVPVVDWETGSLSFSATGAARFFLGTSQASYSEVTSPQTGLSNGTYYLAGANAYPTGPGLFTGADGGAGLDTPSRVPTLVLEPPAAATGFTPTLELANGVNCTWTDGDRVGHDVVQFRLQGNSTWQTAINPATSPTVVSDFSATGTGNIEFRIQSVNHWGTENTSLQNVTISNPAAVTGIAATNGASPVVSWDDSATVNQWVVTYRKKKLAGDDAFGALDTVTDPTVTLSSPAAGRYDFHVVSQNFLGSGTAGDVEAATSVPNTTTGLTGSQVGADVPLTWDLDANDLVTSWQVEGDLDGGGFSVLPGASALTTNSYNHVGATPGTWTYRVTPTNIVGNGTAQTSDPIVVS